LIQLFKFLNQHRKHRGKPLSDLDPAHDYDTYLHHVLLCLEALQQAGEDGYEIISHPLYFMLDKLGR
jgi:hypothetical protein